MSQITLVEAGAASSSSHKKARKAVAKAMKVYEEKFELPPDSALLIPDVGIAFLRSVGAEGKVSQMASHRLAISQWLVDKKVDDWTKSDLSKLSTKEPKVAMIKAPTPADNVTRDILFRTHQEITTEIASGNLHPLIGTRTNVGQHCAVGGALRGGEIAGAGTGNHGPSVKNMLVSMEEEPIFITPHRSGEVAGEPVLIKAPFSVGHLEEHKTSLEESRILIAGETFIRRLDELATAWGRPWKLNVELPGQPSRRFRHMDSKVLRIGLQGINVETPGGAVFLASLVQVQTSHNHDATMRSPLMLKWLRTTVKQKSESPDLEQRWINVMEGTEALMHREGPAYIAQLNRSFKLGLRNLYTTSEGRHGALVDGGKISASVVWAPLLCSTAGSGSLLRVKTPMPIAVKSLESDMSVAWLSSCQFLGLRNYRPSSHGGRREACYLARKLASQANISPVDLRERVNYFFRWTPEKDRLQIHYSGHMDWADQLKMTVMFWLAGGQYDY